MARTKSSIPYTTKQLEWVKNNVTGLSNQELTDLFNQTFNTEHPLSAIRRLKFRLGLHSGLPRTYQPGHKNHFKGKPIGEELLIEGLIWIRTGPKQKVQKHKYLWEQANGPVPNGYVVIFGDGNRRNFDLTNLILVSRRQLLTMNRNGLIQNDADLTRTGVLVAELLNVASQKKSGKAARGDQMPLAAQLKM